MTGLYQYHCHRNVFLILLIIIFFALLKWHYLPDQDVDCKFLQDEQITDFYRKWQDQTSFLKEAIYLPLQVPYRYLVGSSFLTKKCFAVGIRVKKNKDKANSLAIIQSIFDESSPINLDEILVIIYLADADYAWVLSIEEKIKTYFSIHIAAGRLVTIQAAKSAYPPLKQVDFNKDQENSLPSVQENVDFAFLINFISNLSKYVIILEDNLRCMKNCFNRVKAHIAKMNKGQWVSLHLTYPGQVGKLYHNYDCSQLARFLLLFYDKMSLPDLLLQFQKTRVQQKDIIAIPQVFW
ncbi:alpha-1,3-mannosyl-glycoprotein 4-beta-N-acetylglucosaminyltransferase C-like [Erpetoichthys calabaricus]|nr:alpha-1,3-mannosyl-glycoprotein 4-beta-N-acetylglucosaminyltransferase C-like [Erpetoichthys calabaricus]